MQFDSKIHSLSIPKSQLVEALSERATNPPSITAPGSNLFDLIVVIAPIRPSKELNTSADLASPSKEKDLPAPLSSPAAVNSNNTSSLQKSALPSSILTKFTKSAPVHAVNHEGASPTSTSPSAPAAPEKLIVMGEFSFMRILSDEIDGNHKLKVKFITQRCRKISLSSLTEKLTVIIYIFTLL